MLCGEYVDVTKRSPERRMKESVRGGEKDERESSEMRKD